ncbi:uncharacterized protein PV09_04029 [Verruconis gallopava]|uniref:T6SS Phospholipase effector Tle1-like catalytic domain-containing protein n=1 Tax=Verruconis gallopava TaxID=253628 RepID=A0A0D1YVX5_9PEZI|nr:uncharacterized protein PV09_04029 [Verruconis gallopava]KIW04847.1 hypothetical protein PV09_04029 [Verruconis gallopava]
MHTVASTRFVPSLAFISRTSLRLRTNVSGATNIYSHPPPRVRQVQDRTLSCSLFRGFHLSSMPDKNVLKLPKKLIVACDGTWMNSEVGWTKDGLFDAGHPQLPSNVTRFVRALSPESADEHGKHPQIAYYQSGIGTSWSLTDKFLGGGLALGLSEHVREAYGFLVNNYHGAPGDVQQDQIFLIGFSRGAYTARSVAGMIGCLGLLTKSAMRYFYQIFEDFENAGDEDYEPKLAKQPDGFPGFKIDVPTSDLKNYLKAYAAQLRAHGLTREVQIKAVGVWDTVGSLGLPVQPWLQKIGFPTTLHSYRFFDTGVDDHIENAFHVMALDEHRSAFGPTVWAKKSGGKTNLKQVWIPGVHTNVGGGADDNGMCDISLAWMMSQLRECGLNFNIDYFKEEVAATQKFYADHQKELGGPWKWGLGRLGNSFKFPTSLAGSVVRTPKEYHVVDYKSGKQTSEKLANTHEKIHICVRARYVLNGLTYNGRKYESEALRGWTMPTFTPGQRMVWKKEKGNLELEEDELGYYEKILLEMDKDAVQFLATGK